MVECLLCLLRFHRSVFQPRVSSLVPQLDTRMPDMKSRMFFSVEILNASISFIPLRKFQFARTQFRET
jgi:hypothetical protein